MIFRKCTGKVRFCSIKCFFADNGNAVSLNTCCPLIILGLLPSSVTGVTTLRYEEVKYIIGIVDVKIVSFLFESSIFTVISVTIWHHKKQKVTRKGRRRRQDIL